MAFLLDAVTLSEFRRAVTADPAVFRWQSSLLSQSVYLSVITLNEIWYGIRKPPVSCANITFCGGSASAMKLPPVAKDEPAKAVSTLWALQ